MSDTRSKAALTLEEAFMAGAERRQAEIAALREAVRQKFELFDGQVRLLSGTRAKPWLWPEEQAVRRALEEKS